MRKKLNSFNQFLIEHFYLEKNTIDQIRKKENFVEKNSEFVISELVDETSRNNVKKHCFQIL